MTAPLTVDVTGWIIARLQGAAGARFATETPADLEDQLPFVRPVRTGGPDDGKTLDIPTVVFHCFAGTDHDARVLAYAVRDAVAGLRDQVADGAVVTIVRKLGGPFRAAYDNPAVRHQVLTMQLRITVQ